MASTTDATAREMGLQFDPNAPDGVVGAGENRSAMRSPTTPLRESQEQEIMVGSAGRAVLVGDEADLESDGGRVHPSSSQYQTKGGVGPNWLRGSSSKTKRLLCLIVFLLLAFIAVMIVGVVQLPSSPTDDDGGISGVQTDDNEAADPTTAPDDVDTDADVDAEPVPVVPSPTPKPNPSTPTTTSSPTSENVVVPVSNSEVDVVLSAYLEMKVPDFSDELSSTEEEDWALIEAELQSTISASLSVSLPAEYELAPIRIKKFDGFDVQSIRKRKRKNRRRVQTETIHSVVYSTSVTVGCTVSDCSVAEDTVADATSGLTQLDYIVVSANTEAPVYVATSKPTDGPADSPVASTPAPVTPAPSDMPTPIPTPQPTPEPLTSLPMGPLSLEDDDCDEDSPCGKCTGSCFGDDECEDGLLCFQRRGYDFIPGCEGPGKLGQSYCYDPFSDGLTEDELLSTEDKDCDKKEECDKCRGDCDEDEDCGKNLFCFRRTEFERVPGCAGQGAFGTDYCFDPDDLEGFGDF